MLNVLRNVAYGDVSKPYNAVLNCTMPFNAVLNRTMHKVYISIKPFRSDKNTCHIFNMIFNDVRPKSLKNDSIR